MGSNDSHSDGLRGNAEVGALVRLRFTSLTPMREASMSAVVPSQ
jgi:hypothetical protein